MGGIVTLYPPLRLDHFRQSTQHGEGQATAFHFDVRTLQKEAKNVKKTEWPSNGIIESFVKLCLLCTARQKQEECFAAFKRAYEAMQQYELKDEGRR